KGTVHDAHALPSRVAQRPSAGDHITRRDHVDANFRCSGHRAGLRLARHGSFGIRGRARSRLSAGHGHRSDLEQCACRRLSGARHRVWPGRSAPPRTRMTAVDVALARSDPWRPATAQHRPRGGLWSQALVKVSRNRLTLAAMAGLSAWLLLATAADVLARLMF